MKNFDIENVERKNIYKTPEHFFDKVQQNVLEQTVYDKIKNDKKIKPIHLNIVYAIAASFALVFAVTDIILNKNKGDTSKKVTQTKPVNFPKNNSELKSSTDNIAIAYQTIIDDINEGENFAPKILNSKNSKLKTKAVIKDNEQEVLKKQNKMTSNPDEIQLEQIMSQLSNKELADLSNGAEQDVYLDLYN